MNYLTPDMQRQHEDMLKQIALMHPLVEQGISPITALVMAGDMLSAEAATRRLASGGDPMKEANRVGSYARFDWAIKHVPRAALLEMLPELWRGADPDDTRAEYLALWREAYSANGNKVVLDSEQVPPSKGMIYRGQVGVSPGLSWTTDLNVARKFARTGGGRGPVAGGAVLAQPVSSVKVLAFITGRGESEVIVDYDYSFTWQEVVA